MDFESKVTEPSNIELSQGVDGTVSHVSKFTRERSYTVTSTYFSDGSSTYSEDEEEREQWTSKWSFFMSMVGYIVTYGSFWRFPVLCFQSGGVAFFIPIILSYVVLGLPMVFLESALGQFTSRGLIGSFNVCPLFKGLTFTSLGVLWVYLWFVGLNLAWTLNYFFSSFGDIKIWSHCEHEWNTHHCIDENSNETYTEDRKWKTPSEEYWEIKVANLGTGIEDFGSLAWRNFGCNILSWLIVFICTYKGLKSIGKLTLVTSVFPAIMLSIILVRGMSLPGASYGIRQLLTPDWSKLGTLQVWINAADYVFFSMGVGVGAFTTMSSHNEFNSKYFRYTLYLPIVDIFASTWASLVIFTFLGHVSISSGIPISRVARSGPGLLYVVCSTALSKMPYATMWAKLFFLMIFCVGLDCQCICLETFARSVIEELPRKWRKKKIRPRLVIYAALSIFALLVSFENMAYIRRLVNHSVLGYTLMVVTCLECLIISWVYGVDRFMKDIELMGGYKPSAWWKYMWKYITPGLILIMYINGVYLLKDPTGVSGYKFPRWALGLAKFIGFSQFAYVPLWAIYAVYRETSGSISQRALKLLQPDAKYHPRVESDRQRYVASFSEQELLRFKAAQEGVDWRTYKKNIENNMHLSTLEENDASIQTTEEN